jgi:Tfp pilus assembly protein PilF
VVKGRAQIQISETQPHSNHDSPCPTMTSYKSLVWIVTGGAICFASLHLYAAFFPSAVNWGFHHLFFYPTAFRIVVPFLMLLFIIPSVQNAMLRFIQKVMGFVCERSRFQRLFAIIFVLIIAAAMFWFGRQRTFFLGDGFLALRDIPLVKAVSQVPEFSQNAPVPGLLVWLLKQSFTSQLGESSGQYAYQVLSVLFGVASVLVLFQLVRILPIEAIDKTLVYLFIFVSGSTQLLFGYVENYTPTYFGLLLFLWLSLLFLSARTHLIFPSMAFGLLFTFHFGMIWMLPALGLLYYKAFRQRAWIASMASFIATIIWIAFLLWLSGYTADKFYEMFFHKSGSYIVPLIAITTGKQAYTLFSLWHFLEVANLHLLLSPFALIVMTTLTMRNYKHISLKYSTWMFLLLVALCGLMFTFLINSEIGMSRDWDLFSPFTLALITAAAFACVYFVPESEIRRRLMITMVAVTALHSAVWIMVNASEQRSLERFPILPDKRVWGTDAILYGYEDIAVFYRNKGDYLQSIEYFKRCLEIEPANSRVWANIADVYHMHHDMNNATAALEKAVQLGTRDLTVYFNLRTQYKNQRRFDNEIDVLKRILVIDPNLPDVAFDLGTLLGEQKKDYAGALNYFLQAIRLDSTLSEAYQNIGLCYLKLGRVPEARYY